MKERFYKLARPDGWDFYTGKTINYRDNIGKTICVPPISTSTEGNPNKPILCSNNVIHASRNPLDCFVGANIPCSAYVVEGKPVVEDEQKCGFFELAVIEEITDLDALFGFNYTEAINPINPLLIEAKALSEHHKELLKQWANFFIGNPVDGNYEWLGCVAFDGYEFAEDKKGKYCLGMVTDENAFRMFIDIVKNERQDFADPKEGGYPFPWVNDIFLTDYSYAFFDGKVKVTIFHSGWRDVADYDKIDWELVNDELPKVSIDRAWDKKQPDSIILMGYVTN